MVDEFAGLVVGDAQGCSLCGRCCWHDDCGECDVVATDFDFAGVNAVVTAQMGQAECAGQGLARIECDLHGSALSG